MFLIETYMQFLGYEEKLLLVYGHPGQLHLAVSLDHIGTPMRQIPVISDIPHTNFLY